MGLGKCISLNEILARGYVIKTVHTDPTYLGRRLPGSFSVSWTMEGLASFQACDVKGRRTGIGIGTYTSTVVKYWVSVIGICGTDNLMILSCEYDWAHARAINDWPGKSRDSSWSISQWMLMWKKACYKICEEWVHWLYVSHSGIGISIDLVHIFPYQNWKYWQNSVLAEHYISA